MDGVKYLTIISPLLFGYLLMCVVSLSQNYTQYAEPCGMVRATPVYPRPLILGFIAPFNTTNDTTPTLCIIDVRTVIEGLSSVKLYVMGVICTSSFQVVFTNENHIKKGLTGNILRLEIMYCHIDLESIGVLGEVMSLNILRLFNCSVASYETWLDGGSVLSLDAVNHSQTISGLENLIGLLISETTPNQYLPDLVCAYQWPNVTHFGLNNISLGEEDVKSVLAAMPNLLELYVEGNTFPSFSVSIGKALYSTVIEDISFTNGLIQKVIVVSFGGALKKLNLSHNLIEIISTRAFQNSINLEELDLSNNRIRILPKGVFKYSGELKKLKLDHNLLTTLTAKSVYGLSGLTELSITHNRMQYFAVTTLLRMSLLSVMKLSSNNISSPLVPSRMHFGPVSSLKELYLANNNLDEFPIYLLSYIPSVDYLDLSGNQIDFKSLKTNGICNNFFDRTVFDYDVTVNLSKNLVTDMHVSEEEIESCKLRLNKTLTYCKWNLAGNKLKCDCNAYPFYRLVQLYKGVRKQKYLETWTCDSPHKVHGLTFRSISAKDFMCEIQTVACPHECQCLILAYNDLHLVNCSSRNLTEIPTVLPNGTYQLDLQNNNIASIAGIGIYMRYLSLKVLDLSNNYIQLIDDDITYILEGYTTVRLDNNNLKTIPPSLTLGKNATIFLSGNQFGCNCHSERLVNWLAENDKQIPDFESIQCHVPEQSLNLPIKERYETKVRCIIPAGVKVSIALVVVLVVMPLTVGLLYKYRDYIKVCVYIHFKWHPFNRSDDTDIEGKRFDAVVAYADEDLGMVRELFAQRLESPDNGFQLCIKERNFYPGAPKTENASCAMENSRRMILCVTRSFLNDQWCLFDFRLAHARVIMERTNYIIFILFDDIDPRDMENDMRIYLQTNSYIKHNDKMFWEKLVYAMPEVPLDTMLGFVPPDDFLRFPFPVVHVQRE